MKDKITINKMIPYISDLIKKMGRGLPTTFIGIDNLPYKYTEPVFEESKNFKVKEEVNNIESYYSMYVNVINVNGFYYPAEIFSGLKLEKDFFNDDKTPKLRIYLKKKYQNYSEYDNYIEFNKNPKVISENVITFADLMARKDVSGKDLKLITEKKKIVVSVPSTLVYIEGTKGPYTIVVKKKTNSCKKVKSNSEDDLF